MNIMTKTPLDFYYLLLYFVGCIFFETGGLKMKYLGAMVFLFLVSFSTISSVTANVIGGAGMTAITSATRSSQSHRKHEEHKGQEDLSKIIETCEGTIKRENSPENPTKLHKFFARGFDRYSAEECIEIIKRAQEEKDKSVETK